LVDHPVCFLLAHDPVKAKQGTGDFLFVLSRPLRDISYVCLCRSPTSGIAAFDNGHYACVLLSVACNQSLTSAISSSSCGVFLVILLLAASALRSRISSRASELRPGCLFKMLVTRLLVCSLAKATRTRRSASRTLIVCRFSLIALSMIGRRSAPYSRSAFCCSAFSRNAAPTAETLTPSRFAIRWISALTMGFVQRVSWTVRLLATGVFCDRGV